MVVAQLVERLLPTPEVRGSKPVISKKFNSTFVNCFEKTKIKETGNGPFKKELLIFLFITDSEPSERADRTST